MGIAQLLLTTNIAHYNYNKWQIWNYKVNWEWITHGFNCEGGPVWSVQVPLKPYLFLTIIILNAITQVRKNSMPYAWLFSK